MNSLKDNRPKLGILDYGMGNLRSVHRAFLEVGADAEIVEHTHEMEGKDALVFPGQGAIVDTMRLLEELQWTDFLKAWIREDRPFFGICLGLQALFDFSEEGNTPGLGILQGKVQRFDFPLKSGLKIPHMGWNDVEFMDSEHDLLKGIRPQGDQFYFVHSYYVVPEDPDCIWGKTRYGPVEFCSAVKRGNLLATQFHPEKSQAKGLALYNNFVNSVKSCCAIS